MNHADHVALLRAGVPSPGQGGVWADLGSGSGAFTLALAELLGQEGIIWSVDIERGALNRQELAMRGSFPRTRAHYIAADFRRPLDLPPLDGLVMANSLHFVRDAEKGAVLDLVRGYLKPGGRLLLVEYNTDHGNRWVPHPLSFNTWRTLVEQHGFTDTRLLARRPSRFLGEIFAAGSTKAVRMDG